MHYCTVEEHYCRSLGLGVGRRRQTLARHCCDGAEALLLGKQWTAVQPATTCWTTDICIDSRRPTAMEGAAAQVGVEGGEPPGWWNSWDGADTDALVALGGGIDT